MSSTTAHADTNYGVLTESGALRFERLLPGPVERIWAYLTEPDKLRKWLAGGSVEGKVGGVVGLTWRHEELSPVKEETPEECLRYEGSVTRWRVTRWDPPRALAYRWSEGKPEESEVTFELLPRGNKVLLIVTHERLRGDMRHMVSAGWHTHLSVLQDHLEGRTPKPYWTSYQKVKRDYERRIPND